MRRTRHPITKEMNLQAVTIRPCCPRARKRWPRGDYVIPKKHGKEVEEDTDPYASNSVDDDNDDLDDDRNYDRNRDQGNRDTNAKSRRFDPDSS